MFWKSLTNHCKLFHFCWLFRRLKPPEKPDNVLEKLNISLQDLSLSLDQPEVKTAINAFPKKFMNPIIEGLRVVLIRVRDYLSEQREQCDSIANINELLETTNSLLGATDRLSLGEKRTLDDAKKLVRNLQNLPSLAKIEEILTLINDIFSKLEDISVYGSSNTRRN